MKNLVTAGIIIGLAGTAGAMSRPPCEKQSKHPNPETAVQCGSEQGTGKSQFTCSDGVCPVPE